MVKKPNGYWKNLENIELEAKNAMLEQEWEELPSHGTLAANYSSLSSAIGKNYPGRIEALRIKLGGKSEETKPPGYWKSIDNIITETQDALQENNWIEIPSWDTLIENKYSSLAIAIYKNYPGGIQALRKDLGSKSRQRKKVGYWSKKENIIFEAQKVIVEKGWKCLPSIKELTQNDYGYLASAIDNSYPGRIQALRKDLGYIGKQRKASGYWKDPNNIVLEAQNVIIENKLSELPTGAVLKDLGYASLLNAIEKYYSGGLRMLRTDLRNDHDYFKSKEQLVKLLENYVVS